MGGAAGEPGSCGCLYRVAPAGGTAGPGTPGRPLTAPKNRGSWRPLATASCPATPKKGQTRPLKAACGEISASRSRRAFPFPAASSSMSPPPPSKNTVIYFSAAADWWLPPHSGTLSVHPVGDTSQTAEEVAEAVGKGGFAVRWLQGARLVLGLGAWNRGQAGLGETRAGLPAAHRDF